MADSVFLPALLFVLSSTFIHKKVVALPHVIFYNGKGKKMTSMKKIVFITTGGTIASAQSEEGLVPALTSDDIMKYLGELNEAVEICCEDLLQLDSSNMQPEEWGLIARRIAELVPDVDGIVLTHGTDTMAYTASALSFMLQNLPIPVVITGSQLPLVHPLSDGLDNIRVAFAAVLSELQGVFIAFNRKVMLGCRTVKVRTMGFDAFESVNVEPIGIVDARGLHLNQIIRSSGKIRRKQKWK